MPVITLSDTTKIIKLIHLNSNEQDIVYIVVVVVSQGTYLQFFGTKCRGFQTSSYCDLISLLQRDKNGIVMVNFYNNYVTCSPQASLSHVAGESDTQ